MIKKRPTFEIDMQPYVCMKTNRLSRHKRLECRNQNIIFILKPPNNRKNSGLYVVGGVNEV